jgi:kumamolisin
MKALFAGLSAGIVFSVCATTGASAMTGPTTASAVALSRARALVSVPNLSAVHTFTIITRSKADKDVAAVAAYFHAFGMSVQTLPSTKNLLVTGTYAQAAQAGHTSLHTTRLRGESVVRTASRPSFSAIISNLVAGTSISPGLHYRPLSVISAPRVQSFFGPASTGYAPADIAAIYNINPVYQAGVTGAGVNVAIAACSDVTIPDVTAFGTDFHLPPLQFSKTFVGGAAPGFVDGEAILDAERVYATAPGAKIYEYLAPDCTDAEVVDVFARIAEDSAKYHFSGASFSYGQNESEYAAQGVANDLLDTSAAIAELGAAGVPLFVSSGDTGAWNNEFQTDVSYPASDTNAIAVGGTTVLETSAGNRLSEVGWSGSGGGISSVFSIPSYQLGVPGAASRVYKNVPDVSMLADPYTGAATFAPDAFGVVGEVPVGGTSVSAPTFNGVWALVNSARHAYGRPNMTGAAAALYSHARDFYDVNVGDNGAYNAKPGYDNMTGLGAPDVAHLVLDLLPSQSRH